MSAARSLFSTNDTQTSEFKVKSVNNAGFTVLYEPENSLEPVTE